MVSILLATHNQDKQHELMRFLSNMANREISCAQEQGMPPLHIVMDPTLPEPEETGETFLGNARIKALAGLWHTKLPSLSDDSGLCIEALGGFPGVISARFAKTQGGFEQAAKALIERLEAENVPEKDWKAYFVCAVCLCLEDAEGKPHFFEQEARMDGLIAKKPKGKGFGYDPIFHPALEEGGWHEETFASMPLVMKESMSHRTKALTQLFSMPDLQKELQRQQKITSKKHPAGAHF